MTWTAFILVLVMAIAASKLARHSLTMLAGVASIAALVWFLVGHPADPEPHGSSSQANLTRAVR